MLIETVLDIASTLLRIALVLGIAAFVLGAVALARTPDHPTHSTTDPHRSTQ